MPVFPQHHDDEEDVMFVPAADPADSPTVFQYSTQHDGLMQVQELGFQGHFQGMGSTCLHDCDGAPFGVGRPLAAPPASHHAWLLERVKSTAKLLEPASIRGCSVWKGIFTSVGPESGVVVSG